MLHGLRDLMIFMQDTIAQVANASEVAKKTERSLFEQAACTAISCSYRILNSIYHFSVGIQRRRSGFN